jgi:hypothetical protein
MLGIDEKHRTAELIDCSEWAREGSLKTAYHFQANLNFRVINLGCQGSGMVLDLATGRSLVNSGPTPRIVIFSSLLPES